MQNRCRRSLLAVIVLSWAAGGVAEHASAVTFTEFPTPTAMSSPSDITKGPDGALWFTESGASINKIGRIDPSRERLSNSRFPLAIAAP